MQKGWIISITLHLVALAAGLFAIPYEDDRDRDVSRVTEVSIITAPQGSQEQAPPPPENAPQVDEQIASIAAPEFDPDAGPAPEADQAPAETVQDNIEDPSARDAEADLTALLEEVAQPDVAVDVAAPDEAAAAPDSAPAMAMPGDTGLDNRNETPRGPQMAAPPAPRSAPRIADFQPPAPPTPPSQRDTQPASTPEETETAAAEPQPEAQPEEASPAPPSEVESGAEEGNALRRSTAPRARPRNFETQLAEAEADRKRQDEEARIATAEQREREEQQAQAAADARREAEAAAVAEALASAQNEVQDAAPTSDPMTPPGNITQELPVGPPMTQGEKDALRLSVQRCWNVPAGLANASDLRVVVAVELSPNGQIVGQPRLIEPADASRPEIRVAFETARRALLRCQGSGYDLPQEKFAQWKNLEVAFDPKGMLSRW